VAAASYLSARRGTHDIRHVPRSPRILQSVAARGQGKSGRHHHGHRHIAA
jgi:hypothetical protein